MISHRRERVESLLVREISNILLRKAADPRLRGVHIVSVNVSPDFHLARVFYSTLDIAQNMEEVQKGLDSAKSFIRSELKKTVQLRVLPEIAFCFDESIRRGDQILGLLRKLGDSREASPAAQDTRPQSDPKAPGSRPRDETPDPKDEGEE